MAEYDFKHDPGPWAVKKDWIGPESYGDGDSIPVFPVNGGVAICDVVAVNGVGLNRPDIQEKAEANARLIAIAPELPDVIIQLMDDIKTLIDGEGCDHDAGICNCHFIGALEWADGILKRIEGAK